MNITMNNALLCKDVMESSSSMIIIIIFLIKYMINARDRIDIECSC